MKNIKVLMFFLSLLVVLVSCDEEEYADYTAPDELSDVTWLISLERFAEDPFSINADTHLSFLDLSQGAVSHEWIIEEGNNFLNEGFKKSDSLVLFINEEAGLTTTEGKAHVLFRNSGFNKVRYLNKFSEPVSYKSSVGTFEAVQEGNLWVIDTTFTFDVYAHLKPAFTVLKDGVVVLMVTEEDMPSLADSSTWPTIEIEAATGLQFIDNTTVGRPNSRTWFAPDGVPKQTGGLEPIIKFFKLGTFNAGTIRSARINELPKSTTDKLIPLKVKVLKSSQPFVFDGALKEDENEVISFRVNGEVESFSGEESNFTVHVTNTSGFDSDIAVQTAKVKESDATFIELILSAPIFNSDIVTVSYSGGSIVSADERDFLAFPAEVVQMHFGGNVLANDNHRNFENGNGAANNAFAVGYFTGNGNILGGGKFVYERVESKFYEGIASMKYETPASDPIPNVNLWSFALGDVQPILAGTYLMSYQIFIEPGTTLKSFRTEFNKPSFSRQLWDIENVARGEWVRITNAATVDSDLGQVDNLRFTFRPHAAENPGVTGPQLLYIDDLQFIEVEVRP
jgi:hypothetical protein